MHVYRSERVYEGNVINLRLDEVDARNGGRRRFEVAEHRGGVVVIAQPSPEAIVLVRQHRHAVGCDLWEVPAGMLGPAEDPALAAARELREETGYRAKGLRYLWAAYSSPGFCSELLHFYVADSLEPGEPDPDENEEFEVRTFPLAEAWALVETDRLRDAKSQIALAWAMVERCRRPPA
jgi:ADP-ribose diphosphatase